MFSKYNNVLWKQTIIYKNIPIPFFHATVSWDDTTYNWSNPIFQYSSNQWNIQISDDGKSRVLKQYTNGILSWHTIQYFVCQTDNDFVVDEYDAYNTKLARVVFSQDLSVRPLLWIILHKDIAT